MEIPASTGAELFLIEDRAAEDHDEGFAYRLFPEQIDCIRSGDTKGLAQTFTPDYDAYYRETLPDSSMLPLVLSHLCGCMLMISCEGGLPLGRGAAISGKYLKTAAEIKQVDPFLSVLRQMTYEFANEVCLYKRFCTGSRVVNQCMRYIYEHVQEKIDLAALTRICGYSPSRLQHLFRQYAGMSVTDYIRREKIEKACLLLRHTEMPCALIGQKLAFASQSHFIRQFQREKGITPAKYRKKAMIVDSFDYSMATL